MSTLNEFIASVKTEGMMNTNRFTVEMGIPPILADTSFADLQKILLHCEAVNLPGINISTQPARTFGEIREMPYDRLYENVNFTFLVDNSMQVKYLFDTWANNSIQNATTRKFNYYKQYITDMSIYVYDRADNSRYTVKLYECFPKQITGIQLDHNSRDVMKLQVSMNYRYWDSNAIEGAFSAEAGEVNGFINPTEVPDTYFTNFNAYQAGYNSFENARNSLYASETQTIGLGSILT